MCLWFFMKLVNRSRPILYRMHPQKRYPPGLRGTALRPHSDRRKTHETRCFDPDLRMGGAKTPTEWAVRWSRDGPDGSRFGSMKKNAQRTWTPLALMMISPPWTWRRFRETPPASDRRFGRSTCRPPPFVLRSVPLLFRPKNGREVRSKTKAPKSARFSMEYGSPVRLDLAFREGNSPSGRLNSFRRPGSRVWWYDASEGREVHKS